jgi:hypothetical protein
VQPDPLLAIVDSIKGGKTTDDKPAEHSTWTPVDLTEALSGIDVPGPVILERTDGVTLLYAGRTHQFAGESESCKTWAALAAVADVLADGGTVLWIDFEDDDRGIVARLRAMMVPVEAIRERFTYIHPEEPLANLYGVVTPGGLDFGHLLERRFDLAVIDGVTEAMTTEGLDMMSNADIATWSRRLPKRLAATGAATVMIDHVTKSTEGRGRYAIGGQHKLAGLTGAAFRFDVIRPLARAVGADPVTGSVKVSVMKDRPGHVRAHAVDDVIGMLELTSYADGSLSVKLAAPGTTSSTPDIALMGRIAEHLERYEGATKNALVAEVQGKTDAIREALKWMADPARGWVLIERSGQSHRHHLTDDGRKALL